MDDLTGLGCFVARVDGDKCAAHVLDRQRCNNPFGAVGRPNGSSASILKVACCEC